MCSLWPTYQWDRERSQREASRAPISLIGISYKHTGLEVKWLKSPALESGLTSPFPSCATVGKLNLPGPQFPQLGNGYAMPLPTSQGLLGKLDELCQKHLHRAGCEKCVGSLAPHWREGCSRGGGQSQVALQAAQNHPPPTPPLQPASLDQVSPVHIVRT